MESGLTPKQERYCQERNRGLSQRQAYRAAYPSSLRWKDASVDSEAAKLEGIPKVLQRLDQLRRESAKASVLDKAKYLKGIDQLFNAANNVMVAHARDGGRIDRNAADSLIKAAGILIPEAERAEERDTAAFTADFGLLLSPDLIPAHRAIHARRTTDIFLKGGRGSTKSSAASLEVVARLEAHPMEHAAVLMKYANNLRQGVLSQVEWACEALGVSDHWQATRSPMELTNTRTGQKVFFRGCDDPRKLKSSIKPPFGHIGVVWYEEADLFDGFGEIRSVNQTLSRGGETVRLYTYNPPRSKWSWINRHVEGLSEGVFGSCYTSVPPEWLGPTFVEDAEWLRANDERAYRHEYLGEPVGDGSEVFDRVRFREVTDEEIAAFDDVRLGQDFGWYPDPWALTASEWQQSGRTLITFYEDGGNKLHPGQQAERILDALDALRGMGLPLDGAPVYSDDASPEAISAQRDAGVNARRADKGGMRDASYRFLQSCNWVIDPRRCPRLAAEVRAMAYEVSKDGEVLQSIPDGHDHWVDAVRYSMMRTVRRSRSAYRE